MSSYQDIDIRLKVVEDKVKFIMTTCRMRGVVGNGLFDSNGNPTGKLIEGSLLDFYHLANQQEVEVVGVPVREENKEEQEQVNG